MGCVYRFINKVNGKSYVGQTMFSFKERLRGHLCAVRRGSDLLFAKALKKYDLSNFEIQFLEENIQEQNICWSIERFYIEYFNTNAAKGGHGYNLTDGGDGTRGFKWSESGRKYLSNYSRQLWCDASYRRKLMVLLPVDLDELMNLGSVMTWMELAEYFDVSSTTVKKWFKENGVKKEYVGQNSKNRRSWTSDEEKLLMELYLEGKLIREIAIVLHRSENSVLKKVQNLCDKNGIPRHRFRRVKVS